MESHVRIAGHTAADDRGVAPAPPALGSGAHERHSQ
jgi:hypothetical protein